MASDEKAAQRLAKRLVANNLLETQKLFGRRDAAVLQFPACPNDRGVVDLGIEPLYRRADRTEKPSRKRPRTNHAASSATVNQGGNPQHGPNAAPNGLSQVEKVAISSRADGGLPLLQRANGRATAAQESQLPAVDVSRGVSSSEPASLELVTSNRARPETASLVASTVNEALAKDRPAWHPPWKMFRGISGHLGWVRSVAVDYSNEWFATGSADRTVKIWDLASGRLKLTLTGHISTVRGIAISPRHPYMFTVGEDKTVKCWDLEQNKVIRNYHGHLSGVYCVSLHPTLDILMTGGRDSTVRVWDIRTRAQIFVLGGHRDTVNSLITQAADPQIVSASVDSTVRMWDLAAGKCCATLTNHKKGVRALVRHPREFSFASASADNIKTWALPDGTFMRNLSGQHREKLVNALAINDDGVLVSGGDDGSLGFWDYSAAHCFQNEQTIVQPGSLDCEAGIFAMAFDHSGSRLITCEADKTIKMWKEDDAATPETHPVGWEPDMRPKRY